MGLLVTLYHFVAGFLIPSIGMGFGIGIDVTLATVAKFRDQTLTFNNWTRWIMLTHIGFPMCGYYVFWGLGQAYPGANFWLGLIGFAFVALFVYEVFCGALGVTPVVGLSDAMTRLIPIKKENAARFIQIMAVSWDALWSGPAKAAQTVGWSLTLVNLSFVIAALVVGGMAHYSLKGAFWLRKRNFADSETMARRIVWAKLVELSVIGGFGVLSLWNGVWGGGNIYASIIMALVFLGVLFIWYHMELMDRARDEAHEAIGDVEEQQFLRAA